MQPRLTRKRLNPVWVPIEINLGEAPCQIKHGGRGHATAALSESRPSPQDAYIEGPRGLQCVGDFKHDLWGTFTDPIEADIITADCFGDPGPGGPRGPQRGRQGRARLYICLSQQLQNTRRLSKRIDRGMMGRGTVSSTLLLAHSAVLKHAAPLVLKFEPVSKVVSHNDVDAASIGSTIVPPPGSLSCSVI